MFDTNSRYYEIEDADITVTDEEGRERKLVYKRRRFVPQIADSGTLIEHTVMQGERLDNVTALYMGEPILFWKICDVNLVLKPEELMEEAGRVIKIVLLQL